MLIRLTPISVIAPTSIARALLPLLPAIPVSVPLQPRKFSVYSKALKAARIIVPLSQACLSAASMMAILSGARRPADAVLILAIKNAIAASRCSAAIAPTMIARRLPMPINVKIIPLRSVHIIVKQLVISAAPNRH